MEKNAVRILDSRRTMAISTIRPDGWPQTTIVGYANDGWMIYFVILRSSQKFANIQRDNRVSVAIGEEPGNLSDLKAVYAGAHAYEVSDLKQAEHAWRLLVQRHPNLANLELPKGSETALMQALCQHVSVIDYSKGLGHSETLTIGG